MGVRVHLSTSLTMRYVIDNEEGIKRSNKMNTLGRCEVAMWWCVAESLDVVA